MDDVGERERENMVSVAVKSEERRAISRKLVVIWEKKAASTCRPRGVGDHYSGHPVIEILASRCYCRVAREYVQLIKEKYVGPT